MIMQKRVALNGSRRLWDITRIGTFKHALIDQAARQGSLSLGFEAMLKQRKRSFTIKVSQGAF